MAGALQRWRRVNEMRATNVGGGYPWVENRRAPFKPWGALCRCSTSASHLGGAYVDGTERSHVDPRGEASFREIPTLVTGEDLQWAARGYDPEPRARGQNSQSARAPARVRGNALSAA